MQTGKRPLDALEFEITDFGEARHALDELPPGIGEVDKHNPGYWPARRRPPQATDRALGGAAVDWLISLPAELRPRELAQQFPRLVNAITAVWVDQARARALIDDLLIDRRGGRRGLPITVQNELRALLAQLDRPAQAAPRPVSTINPDVLRRACELLEAAGYRVIPPGV